MKRFKGIILIAISFFAYSAFSQTNTAPAGNNPQLREAALKANQKNQERKVKVAPAPTVNHSNQVQTIPNSFQIDENDQYQGRREEFLNQMIVKDIPGDFPKYEKWMGIKHYNEIIEEYYRKHLDIVKEKVKAKLLRK